MNEEMSPEDYSKLVDTISQQVIAEFRRATAAAARVQACCRYFKRGALAGLSHPELVDFLGVSSPSIMELSGYSEEEAQSVMDALASISDDEVANATI